MASFAVSGARLGVVWPGGSAQSCGQRRSRVDLPSVLFRRKNAFSRAARSRFRLPPLTLFLVGRSPALLAVGASSSGTVLSCAGAPRKVLVVEQKAYSSAAQATSASAEAISSEVEAKEKPEPSEVIEGTDETDTEAWRGGGWRCGAAVAHGAMKRRGAGRSPNETEATGDSLDRGVGRRGSSDSEIERLRRTRAAAAEAPPEMSAPSAPTRTVICVGDIHGHITKLESLWSNLEAALPADAFATALVIFLGDYNDRGPDPRRVLDFLLALPTRHPAQRHVFLCGNHDLAFAAFVGALPPPPDGSPFKETWDEYIHNEEHEGWFSGPGFERMHVQGRRWGGVIKERWNPKKGLPYKGSIYDAQPTFESYGVAHGSPDLAEAVPEEHKKFLHDLVWIHEEENVPIDTDEGQIICNLIAVHAGLERTIDVNEQITVLRTRDTRMPKVQMLSGRQDVWDIPKDLAGKQTIIVSGHHGKLHIEGLRFIIDEGGGYADKPIAAIVFPSKTLIRSTEEAGTTSQS